MELDNSNQVSSEMLSKQHFDVVIAVAGYESRCTYLSSKIDLLRISKKIVLAFNEKKDIHSRKYNDEQFSQWGFNFYNASAYNVTPLKEILDTNCLFQPRDTINILIDYSGMPKIWYKGIINYFLALEDRLIHARLWFSYSPSLYFKNQSNAGKKIFSERLPIIKPEKKIILIIGLGEEKGRAEKLLHELEAQATFIFYADPAIDERFVHDVLENNQNLIQQIKVENIIKYPIHDLNSINHSLTNICLNFRIENQLVLAPIGPKPFTLMCYILAARYPDIKMLEVTTVGETTPFDRKAQGNLFIYELEFTSEEVDYSD
jgi:hypothetical protein